MTIERDADGRMLLNVSTVQPLADGITGYELRAPGGAALPPFTAGAHVTVRLRNGMLRSYSLANDPIETDRYEIAVKREAAGRGGSAYLVDGLRAGDTLAVSAPMNNFALSRAREFIFVAGGIGITPILSMVRELERTRAARYRLIYLTRSAALTPFADELRAVAHGRVTIHHDQGDPARAFDLWPVFENPSAAHIYCCGPAPLMDSVRDMTGHWANEAVHFEPFSNPDAAPRADDRPVEVRLSGSGALVQVPADVSILEALRRAGHRVPSSCESGTCGSCKTRLLAGEADHRDLVLTDEERRDHIMVCVSRARTPSIEIALP